jgi:hypothetical protein
MSVSQYVDGRGSPALAIRLLPVLKIAPTLPGQSPIPNLPNRWLEFWAQQGGFRIAKLAAEIHSNFGLAWRLE